MMPFFPTCLHLQISVRGKKKIVDLGCFTAKVINQLKHESIYHKKKNNVGNGKGKYKLPRQTDYKLASEALRFSPSSRRGCLGGRRRRRGRRSDVFDVNLTIGLDLGHFLSLSNVFLPLLLLRRTFLLPHFRHRLDARYQLFAQRHRLVVFPFLFPTCLRLGGRLAFLRKRKKEFQEMRFHRNKDGDH
jgi:hypothetical protein